MSAISSEAADTQNFSSLCDIQRWFPNSSISEFFRCCVFIIIADLTCRSSPTEKSSGPDEFKTKFRSPLYRSGLSSLTCSHWMERDASLQISGWTIEKIEVDLNYCLEHWVTLIGTASTGSFSKSEGSKIFLNKPRSFFKAWEVPLALENSWRAL